MGTTQQIIAKCNFGCVVLENELELISHILTKTKLAQISLKEELERFFNLFNDKDIDNIDKDVLVSDNDLNEYIDAILINNNTYFEAQKKYFMTVLEKYKYIKKILCIFSIIIVFSTMANIMERVTILFDKINKFYGIEEKDVKEFIKDVIELNTEVCKLAFKSYFNPDEFQKIEVIFEYYRIDRLFNKLLVNHYNKKNPNYLKNK